MSFINTAVIVLWVVGIVDQANEYRAIRRAFRCPSMTPGAWVTRRRCARASLVSTAVGMAFAVIGGANRYAAGGWFLLAAVLWAVADVVTGRGAEDCKPHARVLV